MRLEYKNAILLKPPTGSNFYVTSYGYKTRCQTAEVLNNPKIYKNPEVDDDREPCDHVYYGDKELSLDYRICVEGSTPMQSCVWICRIMDNISYPYHGESHIIDKVSQYNT